MEYKRLPEAELCIMNAVWSAGEEVPRAALDDLLTLREWSVNTLNTLLTRLTRKGFLHVRKEGKANHYAPLVSREDYFRSESKAFLQTMCGGDASRFVAAVSDELTPSEVEELQALLQRLKEGK